MHKSKIRGKVNILVMISRLLVCLILVGLQVPEADAVGWDLHAQRQQFIEARKVLAAGDLSYFHQIASQLKHYPLYPYLRYDYLRSYLPSASTHEIGEFLDTYTDTVVNKRLRAAWLRLLASRSQWPTFLDYYTPQVDPVLRCYHVQAKLRNGFSQEALAEARELWLTAKPQPKECDPVFDSLLFRDPRGGDLIWQRIRLAMAAGELGLAKYLSQRLDVSSQRWVDRWCEMHEDPATALKRWELQRDQPITRAILAHGIGRLAKQDVGYAAARWQEIKPRYQFSGADIAQVERTLAVAAAAQNHPRALLWLDEVDQALIDAEVQRARLRAAIAAQDWSRLVRWTEHEPAPMMDVLRWRYWRARALEETGAQRLAHDLYQTLAHEPDYYGFMAADRAGVPYALNHNGPALSAEKEAEILAHPAILRIQELYLAGYLPEAQAEWEHATTQLTSEQLRVAAALVARWGWYNHAIAALGKAQVYDELVVRFPTPYQSTVSYYAQARQMDPATIYGFMRAESAFNTQARSPAGALGLMQLMPATAQYTAAKLGIGRVSAAQILQTENNVKLGTAYLRMMLDKFDGNLAMAAAAYNAGPGRALQWRPATTCTPAEFWIELIPFTETHKYVRNILFYTTVYQWRMGQQVKPLNRRLAVIPPKMEASTTRLSCTAPLLSPYG